MPGRRLLPDRPTLLRLKDQNFTNQQIGDMYGTSRQAVTLALRGVVEPEVSRHEWPWEVESRHKAGWLYEALTAYSNARSGKKPLSNRQRERLSSFMGMLEEIQRRAGRKMVVDYYPETAVGFRLRERRPDDDPELLLAAPRRR